MTTTLTDLLGAILADPHSDELRLVFADFLEETGEDDRAEFIRVQCSLATWDRADAKRQYADRDWAAILRRRERELLANLWPSLWQTLWPAASWYIVIPAGPPRPAAVFRRGFVEHIALTLADFETHAEAIFRAAPVTSVRFSDCLVLEHVGSGNYYLARQRCDGDAAAVMLAGWMSRGAPWQDRESGERRVSANAVAHGRRIMGLPALAAV